MLIPSAEQEKADQRDRQKEEEKIEGAENHGDTRREAAGGGWRRAYLTPRFALQR